VEGVAVGVEPGERHALVLEEAQVLVAGGLRLEQVVDRDVQRGQEAAGVDLDRVEPQLGDHVERFGK
jgi:hypothetical protein